MRPIVLASLLTACDTASVVIEKPDTAPLTDTGSDTDTGELVEDGPPGAIVVELDTDHLGAIRYGEEAVATLFVRNEGEGPLALSGLEVTGGEFSVAGSLPSSLEPGVSSALEVWYSPTDEGEDVAELVVLSADPDAPEVAVTLGAEGIMPRALRLDLTIDNAMSVTVNGAEIALERASDWRYLDTFEAEYWPGDTVVVGVTASNASAAGYGALLAGVLVDGEAVAMSGSGAWEVTTSAPADGWNRRTSEASWWTPAACGTTSQWGSYGADLIADGAAWVGPSGSCKDWSAAWFRLVLEVE